MTDPCTRSPLVPPVDCSCVNVDPTSGAITIDGKPLVTKPVCSDVLSCLVPGSIPASALAPGPLPPGITVPPSAIAPPGPLPAGVTLPANQITGVIPAANLPPTTHTTTWDPIGNNLVNTVNGVTTTTFLGSLDDEGISIAIVAGKLELRNKAGVLLGSTSIPDSDSQTLTIAGRTISISNGNSITLPAPVLASAFNPTTRAYTFTVDGVTSAPVTIPDNDSQQLSIAGNVISLTNGGSITLPAAAPTTNVNTWSKAGGMVDTVNGVVSTVAIPAGTIVDLIGYNAAGNPVSQTFPKQIDIRETYATAGAAGTQATPALNAALSTPLVDVYTIESLIELTAAGTYVLATPPAALSAAMIGVEIDLKQTGNWVGSTVVTASGGATIDGAASFTFNKTAANQPSRSFRWTGSKWLVV